MLFDDVRLLGGFPGEVGLAPGERSSRELGAPSERERPRGDEGITSGVKARVFKEALNDSASLLIELSLGSLITGEAWTGLLGPGCVRSRRPPGENSVRGGDEEVGDFGAPEDLFNASFLGDSAAGRGNSPVLFMR